MTGAVTETKEGRAALEAVFGPGPTVLVCGSREWRDESQVKALIAWRLHKLPVVTRIVHGDAHGVDRFADKIARDMGLEVVRCPADWAKHGKAAGMIRNREMLDMHKPDLVVAVWNGESRGTMHTVSEANARGVRVEILNPYGLH